MSETGLNRDDIAVLKAATRLLIQRNGKPEGAANFCRLQKSLLSEVGKIDKKDRWLPIDAVLDLEREIGEPIVTKTLFKLQSENKIPDASNIPSLLKSMADMSRRHGEAMESLLMAVEDGHVDMAEVDEGIKCIERQIFSGQRVHDILHKFKQKMMSPEAAE